MPSGAAMASWPFLTTQPITAKKHLSTKTFGRELERFNHDSKTLLLHGPNFSNTTIAMICCGSLTDSRGWVGRPGAYGDAGHLGKV